MHTHQEQQGQAKWTPAAQQPTFQQAKHTHLPSWWLLSINLMTKTAQRSQQPHEQHSFKGKIQMLLVNNCFKASDVHFFFNLIISLWARKVGGMGRSTYRKHESTMSPKKISQRHMQWVSYKHACTTVKAPCGQGSVLYTILSSGTGTGVPGI